MRCLSHPSDAILHSLPWRQPAFWTEHRTQRCAVFCFAAFALLASLPADSHADDAAQPAALNSPLTPEQSLQHFQLPDDLKIELVAAEPQVIDPVAMAFDARGRLWVVEMRDYPNGPAEGAPPQSRVRLLEDRNADGRFETSSVFADNLLFANGVQPWRDGVIVTMAGEVAFLADRDGDGKAEVHDTWYTGFAKENPQLRANHPTLGLDNHVYIANGLRGGDVVGTRSLTGGDPKPISISGMDFRFDPLTAEYEAISGVGQFGLSFDDFGNRFVCSNRNPCKHLVLENRYIKRNKFLAVSSLAEDVSPAGDASRVYALSQAWTTSTLHAGQFTAACGVTIYRGSLLPEAYRGSSFTCEPTGNLVHRDVLSPKGATFTSHYGRDGVEFLATRDSWFRPVNLAHGPDGALYVLDMYRAVIEHPQFMPTELKERPDLTLGNDRGRIYRIVPRNSRRAANAPAALAELPTTELVALLDHESSWQRECAQRLLLERQDASAAAALRDLVVSAKNELGQVHALWTLAGLQQLQTKELLHALVTGSPRVKEQAVYLAEKRLDKSDDLLSAVAAQATSDDARLRFQVALSLGEITQEPGRFRPLLARIAIRDADDHWTRTAVASSLRENLPAFTAELFEQLDSEPWDQPGVADLVEEFSRLAALESGVKGGTRVLADFLFYLPDAAANDSAAMHAARLSVAMGCLRGVGKGVKTLDALSKSIAALPSDARRKLAKLQVEVAAAANDPGAEHSLRLFAIETLRYLDEPSTTPTLLEIAKHDANQQARVTAIESLAAIPAATASDAKTAGSSNAGPQFAPVSGALLDGFTSESPTVSRAIIDALLSQTVYSRDLLAAVGDGLVPRQAIDASRANRLLRHRDKEISALAKELLSQTVSADRQKVISEYQPALAQKADPAAGRELFQKNCATCHRVDGIGVNVAPDIADTRTKTLEALLMDILDPNRAIDSNYVSYTAITIDGVVYTGIISAETANSITLKQPDDKQVTLLRSDLEELKSNGVSLMPVGLEKNISVEQMRDLVSFLKNWRYLDGRVPLGGQE